MMVVVTHQSFCCAPAHPVSGSIPPLKSYCSTSWNFAPNFWERRNTPYIIQETLNLVMVCPKKGCIGLYQNVGNGCSRTNQFCKGRHRWRYTTKLVVILVKKYYIRVSICNASYWDSPMTFTTTMEHYNNNSHLSSLTIYLK